MNKGNQAFNDAIRALAGRPVQREEPPAVDGVTRFAAGSGDGGKGGAPIPPSPEEQNRRLNEAIRDAAYAAKGRPVWEEL